MNLAVTSFRVFFLPLLLTLITLISASQALAMVPVSEAQQLESISQVLPQSTAISEKAALADGKVLVRTVYNGDAIIGYAFNTNDVVNIPAYSGKPINTLIVMDPEGKLLAIQELIGVRVAKSRKIISPSPLRTIGLIL